LFLRDSREKKKSKGVGYSLKNLQISLAAARVNAGLTQEEVAKIMHLNKQTICNWEKGKVIPKQAQLEMMCKIYDIPVDNIFLPIKSTLS